MKQIFTVSAVVVAAMGCVSAGQAATVLVEGENVLTQTQQVTCFMFGTGTR